MPILWKSFEEYSYYVAPRTVTPETFEFRHVRSWFEHERSMLEAVQKLFLRSVRNSNAHPATSQDNYVESSREMARVVVQVANTVWEQVTVKKARILRSTVNKEW